MAAYTSLGRHHQLGGTVAENQNQVKRIAVYWRGLYLKIVELLQQRWQQTTVFILKTVSTKTVWRELNKSNIRGRTAVAQPPITESKAGQLAKKDGVMIIKPDVSWLEINNLVRWVVLTVVHKIGRVNVWRTPKEACIPECLVVSTVKHGGKSVLIWAAISWYSIGPIITLHVRITASDCMDILFNQVHPMVQILFPNNDTKF